MVNITLIYFRY